MSGGELAEQIIQTQTNAKKKKKRRALASVMAGGPGGRREALAGQREAVR